ncbi:MAG: alpha-L-fucosidase [Phycisphaerae bacterium]|nr:alpha-L-fucosidase [Phycisphaerae bacterium]
MFCKCLHRLSNICEVKCHINGTVLFVLLVVMAGSYVSGETVSAPEPYGVVPTAHQLTWHEMEYYGLIHYGLNTYTGQEWGYGDVSPDVFKPTDLNTDQWARAARAGGMAGLILVAKHHDGFCLWPSKTTEYTIAATSWKDGKGDVLGDLSRSCKKYGLKLGVYISPWDRNHAEYGRDQYIKDYHEQWREVLTHYGPVFEVWFDGANGGTGYYGGARQRRSISKDYYQFDKVFKLIKSLQPQAVFFNGSDVDGVRWVGNETGVAGETNWSTFNLNETSDQKIRPTGIKGGKFWLPAEADTTILYPKKWFYRKNSRPRTLKQFTDLYYTTIGRNASFNLGLSPGPDGRIPERDVQAMLAQKKQLDRELAVNLVRGVTIVASEFRESAPAYSPGQCIDGTTKTYWATSDGINEASLTMDFGKEVAFNRLLLQEYIALGQRVDEFTLEVQQAGKWQKVVGGTTIGYKRILRLNPVTTSKARLTLKTDAPCLTLSHIGLYNAPIIMTEPVMHSGREGMVSIHASDGAVVFYAVGEKSSAADFNRYSGPFDLGKGGHVSAYALDPVTGWKSDVVSKLFGIAKVNWKITGCSCSHEGDASVERLIDGDDHTMWRTDGKEGRQPPPQWVTIDLGETINISGFTCMPRGDGSFVGLVDRYEFYLSHDGTHWGSPVSQGEFSNIQNNPIEQVIRLSTPQKARFVKFNATHALEANDCVVVCELGIVRAVDQQKENLCP